MREHSCMSESSLIDYVDGEVTDDERLSIEKHLEQCARCAAYVESLRRTLAAVAADKVPEPPPGYWEHFERNVRNRIEAKRRRFRLVLIPGLAGAAVCVLLVVLYTWVPVEPGGDMEMVIAEINTSEVTEEVLLESGMEALFLGQIGSDAGLLDEYLLETGTLPEIVDGLSEDEERDFINKLSSIMEPTGCAHEIERKEC